MSEEFSVANFFNFLCRKIKFSGENFKNIQSSTSMCVKERCVCDLLRRKFCVTLLRVPVALFAQHLEGVTPPICHMMCF